MKFSEEWLRQWINLPINISVLCDQLNKIGLDIDSVKKISGYFSGVVVGEIINYLSYNESKKLFVYLVDIGLSKNIRAVSKKFYYRKNMKVAIALNGAILPEFKRVNSFFLDKEIFSEGIICCYSMLKIDNHNEEIIEFSSDIEKGLDVGIFFSDKNHIISISALPNRPDLLSIFGIARELAILNHISFRNFKFDKVPSTINTNLKVIIDPKSYCVKYVGRIIKNVDISIKSPFFIKERLRRSQIISKNIIEDLINYIMIEFNQLIHIFDANNIGKEIFIKNSSSHEKIVLYNNQKFSISKNQVLITNSKKEILSLNGIFNSKISEVTKKTQDIFLGCMHIENIDKNHIFLEKYEFQDKIEWISRFKKGIDHKTQSHIVEYATKLLIDCFKCNPGPIIIIENKRSNWYNRIISLNYFSFYKILGFNIDKNLISETLLNFGYKIIFFKHDKWRLVIPTWRFDINIEEDIITDVIRFFGYEKLFSKKLKIGMSFFNNKKDIFLERLRILLVDKGYNEVITYSFVNPKVQSLIFPEKKFLLIQNPISIDMSAMRLSLWIGLLNVVLYNMHRQRNTFRLFEIGMCFKPTINNIFNVDQQIYISGLISGYYNSNTWNLPKRKFDFFDLKGDVESILELFSNLDDITFKLEPIDGLEVTSSTGIYQNNNKVGSIGILKLDIQNKLGLKHQIIIFEIFFFKINYIQNIKIKKFSQFPFCKRDISIIVDESVQVIDIINCCKDVNSDCVIKINVCDVYQGSNIEFGKKSLSLTFVLYSLKKTLQEKEITYIMDICISKLKIQFKAILRDAYNGNGINEI